VCLACVADSAYRADDVDCLALRAAIIMVIEMRDGVPSGKMQVLDYFSRKQTRVNRGTFGAELNNALEAGEYGMLLRGFMHEVAHGPQEARELMRVVEGQGDEMEVHLLIDAHSVYLATTAPEVHVPNERQLLYTVQSLRDHLEAGRINVLHRVDTRDMLCDALTKGVISRSTVLDAFAKGYWRIAVRDQLHSWRAKKNIVPKE
jgi:hypothetical protein